MVRKPTRRRRPQNQTPKPRRLKTLRTTDPEFVELEHSDKLVVLKGKVRITLLTRRATVVLVSRRAKPIKE